MILTILAVIYITLICRVYGSFLFYLLSRVTRQAADLSLPFIVTCFAGLAFITILFTTFSLFFPVGTQVMQCLLLFPCLLSVYVKRKSALAFLSGSRKKWTDLTLPAIVLLFTGILCILVMHAGMVNHPDTLAYHAPNIHWAEQYPAIPGIAHLNINYGTQSTWFIVCALFSFSFAGPGALTFINAAVVIWFIIFVIQKINSCKKSEQVIPGLLWLLLLVFAGWNYSQIRLTATSASPDFIAALYIWLVIYLFINCERGNKSFLLLLVFLGCFAVTIKLSAVPCLLPALYAWFLYSKTKPAAKIFLAGITAAFALLPFLTRNLISTGYILFPSALADLFPVDWKIPGDELLLFKQYITGYARTHVIYGKDEIHAVMNMTAGEWMPVWWRLQSAADKILLLAPVFLALLSLPFYRKIVTARNNRLLLCLLFCIAGLLFWFIQAPSPRFGLGFLIPFSGILLWMITKEINLSFIKTKWLSYALLLFGLLTLSYTTYRSMYFLNAGNILHPARLQPVGYSVLECGGIQINIPSTGEECGDTPAPCTTHACDHFTARGNNVRDGFKAK